MTWMVKDEHDPFIKQVIKVGMIMTRTQTHTITSNANPLKFVSFSSCVIVLCQNCHLYEQVEVSIYIRDKLRLKE